jgi:hypothetical protein
MMLLYALVLRFPCRRHHHRGHRHPSQLNKLLWGRGRGGVGGGGGTFSSRERRTEHCSWRYMTLCSPDSAHLTSTCQDESVSTYRGADGACGAIER